MTASSAPATHPTEAIAAVLRAMGAPGPYAETRPLKLEAVRLAAPGPGEMRVRITAAGLCHSDLSVIEGVRPRPMPMAIGHEATGVVEETGPGVSDFAPGEHVVFSFVPACGRCACCAEGRPALCEPGARANAGGVLLSGSTPWQDTNGEALHQHLGVSGFATQTVVATASAVRVPAHLAPEIAALFGCAVLTGVGAVFNTAGVKPGESVAVFGLGGVGLAALLGAVAAGAYPIVAVDVVPEKLELAKSLGATHTVLAGKDTDTVASVRAATDGGARHVIETAGSAVVLAQAYAATRRGGQTVTAGLPPPDRMFSVPAVGLVAEERVVRGSYMGSSVPARDIPRYIALYEAGKLPVDRLLTHRLRFDELEINAAFDRLARGEAVRQVVLFDIPAEA